MPPQPSVDGRDISFFDELFCCLKIFVSQSKENVFVVFVLLLLQVLADFISFYLYLHMSNSKWNTIFPTKHLANSLSVVPRVGQEVSVLGMF